MLVYLVIVYVSNGSDYLIDATTDKDKAIKSAKDYNRPTGVTIDAIEVLEWPIAQSKLVYEC